MVWGADLPSRFTADRSRLSLWLECNWLLQIIGLRFGRTGLIFYLKGTFTSKSRSVSDLVSVYYHCCQHQCFHKNSLVHVFTSLLEASTGLLKTHCIKTFQKHFVNKYSGVCLFKKLNWSISSSSALVPLQENVLLSCGGSHKSLSTSFPWHFLIKQMPFPVLRHILMDC